MRSSVLLPLAPAFGNSTAGLNMPIGRTELRIQQFRSAEGTLKVSEPSHVAVDDHEDEDVRAYLSRLWSQDWDSAEDQIYDTM